MGDELVVTTISVHNRTRCRPESKVRFRCTRAASLTTQPVVTEDVGSVATVVVDPDATIAKAALITADQLGSEWVVASRFGALAGDESQKSVPQCADFQDTIFACPQLSGSAGITFEVPGVETSPASQTVLLFPTVEAASYVMDRIGTDAFADCFNGYTDAQALKATGDMTAVTTSIAAPSITDHGDRQVVHAQTSRYSGSGFEITIEHVNVWVQVGRGIVGWGYPPRRPIERGCTGDDRVIPRRCDYGLGSSVTVKTRPRASAPSLTRCLPNRSQPNRAAPEEYVRFRGCTVHLNSARTTSLAR